MKTNGKKIAVWMDHSKAHFISFEPLNEHVQTVLSEHDIQVREDGKGADGTRWGQHSSSNEFRKDHKEIEQLKSYYKTLTGMLEEYDEILLFGPTTAKNELRNLLKEEHAFHKKTIHVESGHVMTNPQLIAFTRGYFTKEKVK